MINDMKKKFQTALVCGLISFQSFSYAYGEVDYSKEWEPEEPNIVLILADDLGYTDLGVYGSEILTPNIDKLASQGVMFSNFHTSASCAPSRAMLLTGVDNHLTGVANIPESLPPEQEDEENYQGVLSSNVVTVATLLNSEGYHTYMSGKWHLGKTTENLPYNRGFEQTLSMADTGADNYEQKPYLPIYDHAHWTRNGEVVKLEEPFYSSELLVDEMIMQIDSNLGDGQPFFGYLPFLAVHMPVQAPKEYTDMYQGFYSEGWEVLRDNRYQSAMDIGLVPESTELMYHDFLDDWEALSESEKQFEAKRMAVYAGMVTAMDYHIGRLIEFLEQTNQLDNTIFIITSDNGPEYNINTLNVMETMGYTHEYNNLGERGSFNFTGPNFASASASPLSYFKFYSGEGGLRVPLIISGPGIKQQESFNQAFTHVTDITPTILSIAGVEPPGERFAGRNIEAIIGKDLTPILKSSKQEVYEKDDYVGYEVAGNVALFNDGYKLIMNRVPLGDGKWYMYDIVNDPGETIDLKSQDPVRFQKMLNLYQRYEKDNAVKPVPDHYNQETEVYLKNIRSGFGHQLMIFILTGITLCIFGLFRWQRKRIMKRK